MPLVEPIELVSPADPIHFIAIGGSGMSGVARMYAELGFRVSGSDRESTPYLQDLAGLGAQVFIGHDPEHLGDAKTVVVSSAIRETNPELAAARARGLTVWHRSAALGAIMLDKRGVGITGTHGKTTTTGMAASLLRTVGAEPSYVIGGALAETGISSALGAGAAFVVEADESDGSFLQYPLEVVVITNIGSDHLVNWGTPEAYREGFATLCLAERVQTVILCADDPGCQELALRVRAAGKRVVTFGVAETADVRCTEIVDGPDGSSMVLVAGDDVGPVQLRVHGLHNLVDAAGAYAAARALGVNGAAARTALGEYQGMHRRLELVGAANDVRVIDDYGHLPDEIGAALTTVRSLVGAGRVVACFQPHLYTRTRDYADGFGQVLGLADIAIVTDVCGAREDPMPGITGQLVIDAARLAHPNLEIHYVEDKEDVAAAIANLVAPGDVVTTHGCGDIYKYAPKIVEAIRGDG